MGATSAARQKELEQLKKMEAETAAAKAKEQQEIVRKQAELDALDKQIAEMKARLGSGSARSTDSLDSVVAMVEQKEAQARHLEELRKQHEEEEAKRQQEMERLRKQAELDRINKVTADVAKFQKVAASQYGQDLKSIAWDGLIAAYPEAEMIKRFDIESFKALVGLTPKLIKEPVTGMDLVTVPAGCEIIGGSRVCFNAFSIGKYEVAQAQWQKVMGSNQSYFSGCGGNCPAERVYWSDTQLFIKRLSNLTGKTFRLPTEAEWEYACRAGEAYKYCGSDDDDAVAWSESNSGEKTHPVGLKKANAWGLYDMSGNVWDLNDWYGGTYPSSSVNPTGSPSGLFRVLRGGSWRSSSSYLGASYRDHNAPDPRVGNFGFRLAAPAE